MHDPHLHRLVTALDAASGAEAADLHPSLETAALRLAVLRRRLGAAAANESPHLAFLRRITATPATLPLAASA
mgnify:CR=1 FL=1